MRNLYAKLATHRRAETVARARDLGLLAPPPSGANPVTPRLPAVMRNWDASISCAGRVPHRASRTSPGV
jgi:hypothetical protein